MAMSHANCDHPRTPAGRAACRKGNSLADGKLANFAINLTQATKPQTMNFTVQPRRSRKAYDRMVEAHMPLPFIQAVRMARQEGWTLTSNVYQDNSNRVQISTEHGTLSLTWKGEKSVVMYRPADTSVITKIADVKVGIARLTGRN